MSFNYRQQRINIQAGGRAREEIRMENFFLEFSYEELFTKTKVVGTRDYFKKKGE